MEIVTFSVLETALLLTGGRGGFVLVIILVVVAVAVVE